MPKAYLNDYDRKIASFRAWFKGKRAEKNINQDMLTRKTGRCQSAESRKLRVKGYGQSEITYKDLLIYFEMVDATDDEILRYMKIGRK